MRVIPSVTNGAQTLVLRSKDAGPDRDVTEFEIGKISAYRSVKALAVVLCFGARCVGTHSLSQGAGARVAIRSSQNP